MKIFKTGLSVFLIVACIKAASAQDPVFSQFYNAKVYLNPALIGDEENHTVQMSYRSQWRGLLFPYNTTQFSYMAPIYSNKHKRPEGHVGGWGISVFNDEAGEGKNLKTIGGSASFAYNLQFENVNTNRLTFALQAGFINRRNNVDVYQWGEQYNAIFGFEEDYVPADNDLIRNSTVLDISAGAFWRYYSSIETRKIRSVYAGFMTAHLNHPDQSVVVDQKDRLPLLHKLHGGIVLALTEKVSLSGNFITLFQDRENQTNVGVFASYSMPVVTSGVFSNLVTRAGAWHRLNDSFIASLEFLTDNLHIGFSYDWNVNSLKYQGNGAGAYEISLGYKFFQPAPPKILY